MYQVVDDLTVAIIYNCYNVTAASCTITNGDIVTTYYLLLQLVIQPNFKRLSLVTIVNCYQGRTTEKGTISTKLGRSLKVPQDVNINSLYNYPVQGTSADGFKMALIDLDRELSGKDARIVHILHDEIIVEARGDIVDDIAATVKDCMERAFTEIFTEVPFVVDPEIRASWGR